MLREAESTGRWNPKAKESSGLRGSSSELGQRGGQTLRWKDTESRKERRRILTEDQSLKGCRS